jgi:hypothetical protein
MDNTITNLVILENNIEKHNLSLVNRIKIHFLCIKVRLMDQF